ncbi:MAG: hypothetical protein GXX83_11060 [Gaiellales bacterium]|nr:hypothetical protein [Gaiellales bacterium]
MRSPVRRFIGTRLEFFEFVTHLLDTEDPAGGGVLDQPISERRTGVQAIVEVFRLNEDVGIQQVGHWIIPST